MRVSRNILKLLALLLMLIDHAGILLFENNLILRGIGRLSFPLFVFLLADGFRNTRDVERYAFRMLFSWVISIIPYSMAFYGQLITSHQNIFLSLYTYLAMYCVLDSEQTDWVKGLCVLFCAAAAEVLGMNYGWYGVLLAFILFYYSDLPQDTIFNWVLAISMLYVVLNGSVVQILAPVAIYLLPEKDGLAPSPRPNKATSIISYAFYPVHLLFLGLLSL